MRAPIVLILLISAVSLSAQPEKGYMIFQTEGEVSLRHLGTDIREPDGQHFLPGDILTIKGGWASFLDDDLKRVTIKEDCTVSFEAMQDHFKKATASLENKYLVYMWEKMNEEEEHTSKKGGVVRGTLFLFFPYDSALILAPSWCFEFKNPGNDPVELIIKDKKHKVIRTIPTTDSVLCTDSLTPPLEGHGEFYWTVRNLKEPPVEEQVYIIPSEDNRNQISKEIENIRSGLKDIPEPERSSIVNDILKMNRWAL